MSSRIPVFVSVPTALSATQEQSYDYLMSALENEGLEQRTLGKTDFGVDSPLNEVYSIARHCSGGLILGFEQIRAEQVCTKPGTQYARSMDHASYPTPWNNLEAGILFGLKLPLIVFRQRGITGGIFDHGVSNLFIQELPEGTPSPEQSFQIQQVMRIWAGRVRETYRAY